MESLSWSHPPARDRRALAVHLPVQPGLLGLNPKHHAMLQTEIRVYCVGYRACVDQRHAMEGANIARDWSGGCRQRVPIDDASPGMIQAHMPMSCHERSLGIFTDNERIPFERPRPIG